MLYKIIFFFIAVVLNCQIHGDVEIDPNVSDEKREKANEILSNFENELVKDPENVRLLKAVGLSYYSLGEYKRAELYFNRVLALTPDDISVKTYLGLAYLFSDDIEKSQTLLNEVVKEDPNNPNILTGLGRILQLHYRFAEADKFYLEALAIEPENATMLTFLGSLRLQQKHYAEALKIYEKLKKRFPQPDWINQEILKAQLGPSIDEAKLQEKSGNLKDAAQQYKDLLATHPHFIDLYLYLGKIYTKMELYQEALSIYERGQILFPNSNALKTAVGFTYLSLADYSRSKKIFEGVIEKEPGNAEAYAGLGRESELIGNDEEAERFYGKALKVDPYNSTALTYLAELKFKQQNYTESKKYYGKLLMVYPEADWVLRGLKASESGPYLKAINQLVTQKKYREAEKLYIQLILDMPDNANAYYSFGQFYHRLDRDKEAIQVFQEGLKKHPLNTDLQVALGYAYLSEKEYNESEKIFERILNTDPRNADAIVGMGKIAEWDKDTKKAEELYKKALTIDRNNMAALSALGSLRMKQEHYQEALRIFEHIDEMEPGLPWVLHSIEEAKYNPIIKEIHESEERKDYENAEVLYRQLIFESPTVVDYYVGLGKLYVQRKRAEEAISVYAEGLKTIHGSNQLLTAMGFAYLALNDTSKALELFKAALVGEPDNAEVLAGLGRVAEKNGETDKAIKYYQSALKNEPNNITALSYLANLWFKEKNYQKANIYYQKLKWLLPNATWVKNALQDIQFAPLLDQIVEMEELEGLSKEEKVQRQESAEKLYRKLLSMASTNPQYYLKFGLHYAEMRKFPEAIQIYQKGLALDPESPGLRGALGFSYLYKEDLDKAQEEFRLTLEKNPLDAEALAGMGRIAELKNHSSMAGRYYNEALAADPDNISALAFMGAFQVQNGNYNQAQDIYQKLLKLKPKAAWVHQAIRDLDVAPLKHRIRLLEENNNLEGALELYRELISKNDSLDNYISFGSLYIHMDLISEAISVFKEGVQKYPDSVELLMDLGNAYIQDKQVEEAEVQFQRAYDISPEKADVIAGLGLVEALKGQPLKAERLYEKALVISPKNVAALSNYGQLLMKEKRFEEAGSIYRRLFAVDPKSSWVRKSLKDAENAPRVESARVLTNLGKYKRAQRIYLDLIGTAPNNPEYYLFVGDLYVSMEKYAEAIEVYDLGLTVSPNSPNLLRAKANAYIATFELCASYEIFTELLDKDPMDANSWAGLGRIYAMTGYYCMAQEYYAIALQLDPDNETALINLAVGDEEQELFFSARARYAYLNEKFPNKQWMIKRFAANDHKTNAIFNLNGKYYEEDEWDRNVDKWVAKYQVYGINASVTYPINDCWTVGGIFANDYYRLINKQDHFSYYYFQLGRGHAFARHAINTYLFTTMRLGVSAYSGFKRTEFSQKTGVAVEPTLSFTHHQPRFSATFGLTSDTDLVARDFNNNRARMVTRYYVFGNTLWEPYHNVFLGLDGGMFYLNGFETNTFQRTRATLYWTPDFWLKLFTFKYYFQFQNYDKVISDYYTYAPQLINHLQIEFKKTWSEWTYVTIGYAHGWQDTRTRFPIIILNQPIVQQPLFWDRRDYNQCYLRVSYDQCPWQIALDADFYRDSKKYTIWHVYLNMSFMY